MIRPRYRAVLLLSVILAVALACETSVDRGGLNDALPWVLASVFLLASMVDVLAARRLRLPPPCRALPERLNTGHDNPVQVTLENPHRRPLRVEYSECPENAELKGLPRTLNIPPEHLVHFVYQLRPRSRGALAAGEAWLYVSGPLGLWETRRRFALPQRARAGANLPALARLVQTANGLRRAAHLAIPAGEQLTMGERPQGMVIWLDTGPSMGGHLTPERPLDCAMDAALALACAAQAFGTRVALHIDGHKQLVTGLAEHQLRELSGVLDTLQPSTHPTDYALQASSLLQRNPQGSWVVLITRLPTDCRALIGPLNEVARHHRFLVADITEQRLLDARRQPIRNLAQARAYCLAMHGLEQREQACHQLMAQGLKVVQIPAERLAEELLGHYAKGCR